MSSYSGLPVKLIKKNWDQKLFRHFDLTVFYLSVFSLIANATFLHHRLNKIKHCLVTGQQSIVHYSCVNIVILTV